MVVLYPHRELSGRGCDDRVKASFEVGEVVVWLHSRQFAGAVWRRKTALHPSAVHVVGRSPPPLYYSLHTRRIAYSYVEGIEAQGLPVVYLLP